MAFSGGGSNITLPHTHDGTVVQDGGSLNMDNVTQANLTAGDVIYSDGTHLQRLAIGTPAQQIKVNAGATAPEYFSAAAGSDIEFIERFGLAAGSATTSMSSSTFTGMSEIWAWYQIHNANDNVSINFRPNNVSTGYQSQARNYAGGNTTSTAGFHYRGGTSNTCFGLFHIMSGSGSYGQFGMTCTGNTAAYDSGASSMNFPGGMGGLLAGNNDLITSLTIAVTAGNIYGDVVLFGSQN